MFDLGDVVPLSFSVTDSTGAPANAGTVTLTITLPDGTSSSPVVVNTSTGLYTASYTTTQAGRHTVRWVATGANASAYTDAFDVRPAATSALVSLADVKTQTNISSSASDEELRAYIEAATDLVEWRIGPVVKRQISNEYVDLMGRTVWNELTTAGTRQIVLRTTPIISLDAIQSAISTGIVYTPSDFYVETGTGIVRRLDNGTIFGPLLVTYTVGRTAVPGSIALATSIIVEHLWQTQRGASSAPAFGDDELNTTAGMFWDDIPNRAKMLLEPYAVGPPVA